MQQYRSTQGIPEVVKHLLIINGLFFISTLLIGEVKHIDLADTFALHTFKSSLFKPWQLITHMFMHGSVGQGAAYFQSSLWHLVGNMFGLWMFGSILARNWESKRFLYFYIACGLGAAFAHLAVLHYENNVLTTAIYNFKSNPTWAQFNQFVNIYGGNNPGLINFLMQWQADANNPAFGQSAQALVNSFQQMQINQATVGASGAVFGILAAYAFYYPNTLLYLYFFFPIKAKWAILAYTVYELYAGMQHSAGDNVAHFAHLGGALVGFLIVLYWNKTNKKTFY